MKKNIDDYLTEADAAEKCQMSRSRLAHLRATGNGPAFIQGGRALYHPEDLLAWMAGRCGTKKGKVGRKKKT